MGRSGGKIPQRYGWLLEPEAHRRCKALNLAWSPGNPESPCAGGCSRSADCRAAPLGLSLSALASGRGRSVRRQYGRGRGSGGPGAVGRLLRSGDLRQQQHHHPGGCHGVDLAVGCPTSEGSGRTGSVQARSDRSLEKVREHVSPRHRLDATGRKVYVIRRMLNGRNFKVSTRATTLRAAVLAGRLEPPRAPAQTTIVDSPMGLGSIPHPGEATPGAQHLLQETREGTGDLLAVGRGRPRFVVAVDAAPALLSRALASRPEAAHDPVAAPAFAHHAIVCGHGRVGPSSESSSLHSSWAVAPSSDSPSPARSSSRASMRLVAA